MSQIVTTDLGRFNHVGRDDKRWWLFECPCGEWLTLSEDQMEGRVSVDQASMGCPVGYHETHHYGIELVARMGARRFMNEPVLDPEDPVFDPWPNPSGRTSEG